MCFIRKKFSSKNIQQIEKIFENGTHQSDVLYSIYALVIPDFEKLVKCNGWPKGGKSINDYICKKFIQFDAKHHPKALPGGLWLSAGFSSLDNQHLDPWQVEVNMNELLYQEQETEGVEK